MLDVWFLQYGTFNIQNHSQGRCHVYFDMDEDVAVLF